MKRLFKRIAIGSIVIIGSLLLVREGMKIGYQLVEDIKTEAVEEYKAEQKEKEQHSKQYEVELLTPLKPVNQYILAQEGIAC